VAASSSDRIAVSTFTSGTNENYSTSGFD